MFNELIKDGDLLPMIGIDTLLAQNTDLSGFDERLYTLEEGKFSMYIDAVEGKVGPSSFAEEDQYTYFGEESKYRSKEDIGVYSPIKAPYRPYGRRAWSDDVWDAYQSY